MKVVTIKTINNMENNISNSVSNVIIPSRRIPIEGCDVGLMGDKSRIIAWSAYGAVALDLDKKSETYMKLVDSSFVLINETKGYTICIADKDFPTQTESQEFVQKMMRDSNFANADKIKFVLYRKNCPYPFAVVVENF